MYTYSMSLISWTGPRACTGVIGQDGIDLEFQSPRSNGRDDMSDTAGRKLFNDKALQQVPDPDVLAYH